MNKLDLILCNMYRIKKDVEYWENNGYIINDFTKSMVNNIIKYLEIKKRQKQWYEKFIKLIEG